MSYLDKFKLEALVAAPTSIGFNDGANKGFWRIQPRVVKGRNAGQWIEMGAELRALLKINGKIQSVIGRSVGSNGTPEGVRVMFQGLSDLGIPDSIVDIPTRFVEMVSAVIPDEVLRKQGIDKPENFKPLGSDGEVPNFEDLPRTEITPDDIRIANDGINSPEGKEQEAYKESAEGKAVEAGLSPLESNDENLQEYRLADSEDTDPVAGITKDAETGEYEATNYLTGEIYNAKSEEDAKRWIAGEYNGDNNAAKKAEEERDRSERTKAYEAERAANKASMMSKEDFINKVVEEAYSGYEEGVGMDKPRIPADWQLEDAYDEYQSLFEMEERDSGQVDKDVAEDIFAEAKAVANFDGIDDFEEDFAKLWNEATYGDGADLDNAIEAMSLPPKGPEGYDVVVKSAKDLKIGDDLADPNNKPVGRIVGGVVIDGKHQFEIKTLDGKRAKITLNPDEQIGTLVPSKAKKTPPKAKNMSNDQLEKLDKLTELVGDVSEKDPQLAKDLKSLNDRIDNVEIISSDEAQKMINRLEKHIKETSGSKKTPDPVDTPKPPVNNGPTFIPKDRPDNGQDVALPKTKENTLWAKKVAPLRDEDGNKVRAIDPATGEFKSTFAEDPDAVLSAILEEYPDAVILEDGAILAERTKFTDPDGTERQLESLIRRTNGNNYMVSFRVTNPDGSQTEYISHDYRDSFSAIHGKKNGIMRMSAILKGDLPKDFLPTARKNNSSEWKSYFASGKFEDRLKYFRGKYNSKATEASLIKALDVAEAGGKDSEIELAKYNLNLLREDFNGDISLYRRNAAIQTMKLITLEETVDKYANGRFYLVNNASGKSNGSVLRSAVEGVYGSIKNNDVQGLAEVFNELKGRLPDMVKDPKIATLVLDRVRQGVKDRFPADNQRILNAFITNGYNAWTKEGFDQDTLESAPHVGWKGSVLRRNMLVEYTNNNNDKSVGIIHSVIASDKNENQPNQYEDYVRVSFRGQDGKIAAPIKISAKNIQVLDDTGLSDETLKQLTIYTPNIKGDEMRRARFGDKYLLQQRSRYSDMFPGATDTLGDGFSPRIVDPAQYKVDDLAPGGYLYDNAGLPVGQIAAVRDTTSESGDKGYTFAHVDPNGKLGFTSVKAGETRAPKPELSKADGRGSAESDAGFTPNPADFADAGFDPASISSDSSDAQEVFTGIIEGSDFYDSSEALAVLGKLAKLEMAKVAYEEADSDEVKAAQKEVYRNALASYYTSLAKYKAVGARSNGAAYTPDSIPGDAIIGADEVVNINAKIKATYKPFNESETKSKKAKVSYAQLIEEYSSPQNTYSGYLPEGWSASSAADQVALSVDAQKSGFNGIIDIVSDGKVTLSDALLESLAQREVVSRNVDSTGELQPLKYHTLTNATGDTISSYRTNSGEGYLATEADLETSASVINAVRSKLNIGDAPLNHVLVSSVGSEGALGYVWTREMWNADERYASFHSVVERVNKFIAEKGVSPKEEFVQGQSWFAVDLSQDPELMRRYVASHELGHVMQGKVLRNLNVSPNQKEWDRLYGPIARSYRISQYGTSNNNEHFAESFARWELTGEADPGFLKFLADAGLLKDN